LRDCVGGHELGRGDGVLLGHVDDARGCEIVELIVFVFVVFVVIIVSQQT